MTSSHSRAPARVVVLGTTCTAANVTANALRAAGLDVAVILEQPVSSWRLARRRVKRLGVATVAGQVLFRLLVVPLLTLSSRARREEILRSSSLDPTPVRADVTVVSANDPETGAALARLEPAAVVVAGTRILSEATLNSVAAPFVNLHAGITPRYRGVHGGYWALVEGRPDLVGSTVHFIDAGIDTGEVLRQATFAVTGRDSFTTYPLLHLAVGIPPLVEVVRAVVAGEAVPAVAPLDAHTSQLRHHPTLWGYLSHRLSRGVA